MHTRKISEPEKCNQIGKISASGAKVTDRADYLMQMIRDLAQNSPSWSWSRGFISSISLTTAAFMGERCQRCDGDGKAHGADRPFEWSASPDYMKCPWCHGIGYTNDRLTDDERAAIQQEQLRDRIVSLESRLAAVIAVAQFAKAG